MAVIPLITDPSLLHFVIPAPEGDAGMMAQTADVVVKFGTDIFHKSIVEGGVSSASEHEILPDANAKFIAEVVERISLVETTAPDT